MQTMYQQAFLKITGTKDTYIGNIYQLPNGRVENALELIENKVYDIMTEGMADIFLAGDFNIDMLKTSDSKCTTQASLNRQLGLI